MRIETILHPDTLLHTDRLETYTDPIIVLSDVMFFSTTTTILGENGVERVTPIQSVEEFESYSDIPRGGESRSEDIDVNFQNRPQSVFGFLGMQDETPAHVCLHSTNGARLVHQLDKQTTSEAEILIGCLRNARAVAEYIQSLETNRSVILISAGSREEVAIEDQLCISCIDQYLGERPVDTASMSELAKTLPVQRYNPDTTDVDVYFEEDDREHASRINESTYVPVVQDNTTITFTSVS